MYLFSGDFPRAASRVTISALRPGEKSQCGRGITAARVTKTHRVRRNFSVGYPGGCIKMARYADSYDEFGMRLLPTQPPTFVEVSVWRKLGTAIFFLLNSLETLYRGLFCYMYTYKLLDIIIYNEVIIKWI